MRAAFELGGARCGPEGGAVVSGGSERDHPYQRTRVEEVAGMGRGQLIAWLEWCDPNGCYSDAQCEVEGLEPLTDGQLRELVGQQIEVNR